MEKIAERIMETEANSQERAYLVESFINEEASHNDLYINHFYIDGIQYLKKGLKSAEDFHEILCYIDEAIYYIENVAKEFSEEKGEE